MDAPVGNRMADRADALGPRKGEWQFVLKPIWDVSKLLAAREFKAGQFP